MAYDTKLKILDRADCEYGMPVDRHYFPPSNRGEVKHLLRKGFLFKKRVGSRKSKTSLVHLTTKGIEWLRKNNVS